MELSKTDFEDTNVFSLIQSQK